MTKVGDLISKKLIVLNSASVAGTVKNVVFDNKITAAKLLEIYDDSGVDAEIKYVEFRRIKNLSSDACVVADKSFVSPNKNARSVHNNPINKECFNQDGKSLGFVTDVVLDGAEVKTIVASGAEFPPTDIISYSDRLVLVNDTGKPVKLYKPKPTRVPSPQTGADSKVTLHEVSLTAPQPQVSQTQPQPTTTAQTQVSQTQVSPTPPDTVKLPARVPPENTFVTRTPAQDETATSAYKFLIGKTLQKDISADNGVVILRKHSIIDDRIIASARDHGKLVQLALHAE